MSSQSIHPLTENAWQNDGSDLQLTVDPAAESVCETVVIAVARLLDESPLELPTLHDTIDPDAVESLSALRCTATGLSPEWTVAFSYADCLVRVYSTGHVTVTGERPTASESDRPT